MPFAVLILQDVFKELPRELEESAYVDGASAFQAFFRIALPLAAPAIAAAGVICFAFSWNEFIFALILTYQNAQPITVVIAGRRTHAGHPVLVCGYAAADRHPATGHPGAPCSALHCARPDFRRCQRINTMLIPFPQLLADARAGGYAVGYFEAWDQYSLEAVVEAAEQEQVPVIIGFGGVMMEPGWFDDGGIERLGALGHTVAHQIRVPCSFILNEAQTYAQIVRGIKAGFNAVMLDSSRMSFQENANLTCLIVETAHAVGVGVEAELGELPDASGEMGPVQGSLTDPEEAARFVRETGIDALSVSVGNVHILTRGKATVDWDRLAAIHKAVDIPLVIHGGTGFPDDGVARAIPLGVAKFNIGTILKQAFITGVAEAIASAPKQISAQQLIGSRKQTDILQQGKLRMKLEVIRRMRLMQP